MTGCLKVDHQYGALRRDVRRLCNGLIPRPRKKPLEKEEKLGQINTMKTNSKRRKGLRLTTWNVRSLYRPGGLRITINELRKYKIAIAAIQETKWNKLTPQAFTSNANGYNFYTSSLANNHGFATTFLVNLKFNHMVKPINGRLSSTYMHQQMTQKRGPRINFMNSWSGHMQPTQVLT
jgi:hypothetical protein